MSKHSQKTPPGITPKAAAGVFKSRSTRRAVLIACAVVVLSAVIAGVAVYRERVAPFRATVLQVDETAIDMDYFLKRAAMSGKPPMLTLETLTKEEIIKQTVAKPPYNITVTDAEIDQFAGDLAREDGRQLDEGEFKEWYRQRLNESRLSPAEFRDLLKTRLLSLRLGTYLAERVPTVAAQVYVHMFPLKDYATGIAAGKKFAAGVDFSALAREYSIDAALQQNGGVLGWIPRGVFDPSFDRVAFELEVGKMSEPMYINKQTVVVIMISDKAAARRIDAQPLSVLQSKALDAWLKEQRRYHAVKFRGLKNGYDTETDAWVQRQLQRRFYQSGEK